MAQAKYLIDTNAIIDYLGGKLPVSSMKFMEKIMSNSSQISIITKIELLGFKTTKKHEKTLSEFIKTLKIIDLTNEVVEKTILIRKNHKIKIPDAIIAATALTHNCNLITRNISDFNNLKKLEIINPYSIT